MLSRPIKWQMHNDCDNNMNKSGKTFNSLLTNKTVSLITLKS